MAFFYDYEKPTIILVGLSWFKPKKSEFQEKKFYVLATIQYPCLDNVLTQATFIK
jgi:hypothetical protein